MYMHNKYCHRVTAQLQLINYYYYYYYYGFSNPLQKTVEVLSFFCLSDWNTKHFSMDYRNAKSEVLTMVTVKVGVLRKVTPCILVEVYGRVGGKLLPRFTFPEILSLRPRNLVPFPSFLTRYRVLSLTLRVTNTASLLQRPIAFILHHCSVFFALSLYFTIQSLFFGAHCTELLC